MGATEDAASRRPARPGGTRLIVNELLADSARGYCGGRVRRLLPVLLLLLLASTATAATIHGSKRSELILGTPRPDRLVSAGGNDLVQAAFGGKDRVDCGPGNDVVSADGSDVVAANC